MLYSGRCALRVIQRHSQRGEPVVQISIQILCGHLCALYGWCIHVCSVYFCSLAAVYTFGKRIVVVVWICNGEIQWFFIYKSCERIAKGERYKKEKKENILLIDDPIILLRRRSTILIIHNTQVNVVHQQILRSNVFFKRMSLFWTLYTTDKMQMVQSFSIKSVTFGPDPNIQLLNFTTKKRNNALTAKHCSRNIPFPNHVFLNEI